MYESLVSCSLLEHEKERRRGIIRERGRSQRKCRCMSSGKNIRKRRNTRRRKKRILEEKYMEEEKKKAKEFWRGR